jgi:hypothetical protein
MMPMNDEISATLAALQTTATHLEAQGRVSETRWLTVPMAGGWSAHAALAHLRASDDIFRPRLLQVVVRDEALLIGIDDKLWQQATGYDRLPADRLIAGFVSVRNDLLHALQSLPPEAWQRAGVHEWRGPLTLLQMAQGMAAHEAEHLDQIESALAGPA